MPEELIDKHVEQGEKSLPADDDSSAGPHVEDLIEELKRRTAELETANRELRRVSHYRSLFLGRMSHELRTPLTSILGFCEILLDHEPLSQAQRRFCQKIQDSGLQLQTSLDQLVDLSRVEANRTELFLQEFSLPEMMRDSCAAVARLAQKRQVKIECDLAPDLTNIVSDQGRLRQILYSFLAWCVSRSLSGQRVSLQGKLVKQPREFGAPAVQPLLRICFEDEGRRVEDLGRVFDPAEGGSGDLPNLEELGVIISRKLLDMLGGSVTVENREVTGILATIELPSRPAKE
jgi:two-component system, NarL family, sensor histidine kinase BarA